MNVLESLAVTDPFLMAILRPSRSKRSILAPLDYVLKVFLLACSEAPKVFVHPVRREAEEGESARFDCVVVGRPVPAVQWLRKGRRIPALGEKHDSRVVTVNNILLIRSAEQTDTGVYSCVASNVAGADKDAVRLIVMRKYSIFYKDAVRLIVVHKYSKTPFT